MTNEEQAKAIAEEYKDIRYDWDDSPVKEYEKIALDMAEWKDQQFKEYLENTIKAYKCRGEKFFAAEIKALENIINELFKEEQK